MTTETTTKRPNGRPPAPEGLRRKQRSLSMSDTEWLAFRQEAARRGVSISELARTLLPSNEG